MAEIIRKAAEEMKRRFALNIGMFNNTNTTNDNTSGNNLSAEMKEYYSKYIIDLAEPELVHDRFADKYPIPQGTGKTITFHKFTPLTKALTPLTEGVTPEGQKLDVSELSATVDQYGAYIETSDVLQMTAVDPIIVQATQMSGSQAGRTLDTITREVLNGGTNVMYAPNGSDPINSRSALTDACVMTADVIKKAAMLLKRQNAPTIDGSYVAIVHPDVAHDIMRDEKGWIDVHKYMDATKIYDGELGKIGNVRFVESTEAKIFMGAGASSANVYSTMVLGAHAYATTDISGGGLKHIVKPLGSAGSADPLDQRSTIGWKAMKTAERLVEQYMIRIESGASEGATAVAN